MAFISWMSCSWPAPAADDPIAGNLPGQLLVGRLDHLPANAEGMFDDDRQAQPFLDRTFKRDHGELELTIGPVKHHRGGPMVGLAAGAAERDVKILAADGGKRDRRPHQVFILQQAIAKILGHRAASSDASCRSLCSGADGARAWAGRSPATMATIPIAAAMTSAFDFIGIAFHLPSCAAEVISSTNRIGSLRTCCSNCNPVCSAMLGSTSSGSSSAAICSAVPLK